MFSGNPVRDKDKNKIRDHRVISMACSLISHSSQPITAPEIAQLL